MSIAMEMIKCDRVLPVVMLGCFSESCQLSCCFSESSSQLGFFSETESSCHLPKKLLKIVLLCKNKCAKRLTAELNARLQPSCLGELQGQDTVMHNIQLCKMQSNTMERTCQIEMFHYAK